MPFYLFTIQIVALQGLEKGLDRNATIILKDKNPKGGLVLIGKAAVLKTAGLCPWGFESLILRQRE